MRTPQDVLAYIKDKDVKMVDVKFIDLPGIWQHFSVPVSEFDENAFAEGFGFDGSSIRGFRAINESDMNLIPDPATAVMDPFNKVPTLSIICDVIDPVTGEKYNRDPRNIAKKAEAYLKASGIADESYWGPEAEFFIFDSIRFDQNQHSGYYYIDSAEGIWNSGREESPNLGYKPRYKEGYFPVPPTDSQQDMRTDMVMTMLEAGLNIECQHHEVATAGQGEIDIKYNTLVKMADDLMMFKYIVKNVARKYNKTATFMPKPLFQDNGTGMHVHMSLWKEGIPLFFDEKGYAKLSQTALYFIGGLLKHAHALTGLTNPTTNSYKRLVPGYEAPVNLVYSMRNRSAAVRIPMYSNNPKTKRVEFRPPDPSCNPYLAFAALLMAGLDGVKNKIDPGQPMDKDIFELPPEEAKDIRSVPGSLDAALKALQNDHEFLLEGGVFDQDVLDAWVEYKLTREFDAIRLRPHPYEFMLYFDL